MSNDLTSKLNVAGNPGFAAALQDPAMQELIALRARHGASQEQIVGSLARIYACAEEPAAEAEGREGPQPVG